MDSVGDEAWLWPMYPPQNLIPDKAILTQSPTQVTRLPALDFS